MKKQLPLFLWSVAAFLPVAALVYILLICLWGEAAPALLKKNLLYQNGSFGFTNARLREAHTVTNVDVLFLGSSHAYRSFDPRLFKKAGTSSFNLGTSAQTPLQTEVLLHRYLPNLNPKTVVYEVYPALFASDGVESALDLLANDRIDGAALSMALRLKNSSVVNTLIYALYRNATGRNKASGEARENGTDTYVSGGFVDKAASYYKPHRDSVSAKWVFNAAQFQAFENIVRNLRQKGIRLVLVQAPVTQAFYQSYPARDSFDRKMSAYGPYYNFNNVTAFNDSLHFYDKDHLNARGVALFDTLLLDSVFKK